MRKRFVLLTPGPTPVPPDILDLLAQPIIHHRTRPYREVFKEVSAGLKDVFRTRENVYTFTASGTGAMEASVVNFLSPGDPVLVLTGGKFGERFCEIADAYSLQCDCLAVPYGEAHDPQAVAKKLAQKPYRAVFTTLLETSTGVLNDTEAIGKVVSETGALYGVDAVSGLLADRFETDAWKVDLAISGSQKGMMVPPGLSFLAVSSKAKDAMRRAKLPRYYWNLGLYEKALGEEDSPFTPAIPIVIALRKSLEMIRKKGIESIWRETEKLAKATRKAVQALGLELFAKRPSNGVTAVKVPPGIDGGKLLQILQEEYGVVMAGGQAEMKGKIFRIAHMGYITHEDLAVGFECLEEALAKLGYPFAKGASVKIFTAGARL